MSKEFKFRVWDKSVNDFLQPGRIEDDENPFLFYNLGTPYDLSEILGYHLKPEDEGGYDRFVVQESIGIKDENDIDIYEGDLVDIYFKCDSFRTNMPIRQVAWLDDRASFGVITPKTFETFEEIILDGVVSWKIKIKGNIFQNPELYKL